MRSFLSIQAASTKTLSKHEDAIKNEDRNTAERSQGSVQASDYASTCVLEALGACGPHRNDLEKVTWDLEFLPLF